MKRVIPEYKNLVDIIQDAVDKESDAEDYYLQAAERAHTAEVRDFLTGLARMERDHHDQLAAMLEKLRAEKTVMDGILSSYDEPPKQKE